MPNLNFSFGDLVSTITGVYSVIIESLSDSSFLLQNGSEVKASELTLVSKYTPTVKQYYSAIECILQHKHGLSLFEAGIKMNWAWRNSFFSMFELGMDPISAAHNILYPVKSKPA